MNWDEVGMIQESKKYQAIDHDILIGLAPALDFNSQVIRGAVESALCERVHVCVQVYGRHLLCC